MGALSGLGFERDSRIEKAIDRKSVLHGMSAESISAYIDALEELLEEYYVRDEFRARNAIGIFIRGDKYSPREWLKNMFSEEERDYWQRFEMVRTQLKNKLLGETYSRRDLVEHVTFLLEKICEGTCVSPEILAAIQEKLGGFSHLRYRLFDSSCAIMLYLNDYQHLFIIANRADACDRPADSLSVSIVVNSDNVLPLLEAIEKQTNVLTVSLRNERGRFERVYSQHAIDWCIERLGTLIRKIDKESESSLGRRVLSDLVECKQEFEVFKRAIKFDSYLKGDGLAISDIKSIRSKIRAIALRFKGRTEEHERHHVFEGLNSIESFLRLQFKTLLQRIEVYKDVIFSLSEIKRNNTLYIASNKKGKKVEYAFGEENLSAMLASNLKCMHFRTSNNIRVHCEALVGNGRSDITIYQGRQTMAIIECKLAREGASIAEKVIDAVDQLYARYSENEFADCGAGIQLFLVVFSHDRSFRSVAESISDALGKYAVRNRLAYEQLCNNENGVTFSYVEDRGWIFSQKKRVINLVVCNLEVDFHTRAKDRKNLKPYGLP
ncbi:TPA: PD-(D/E)XK nuclease domain-containing protein [Pseudomonas aeruginosa]|nr:PD-(D/E)XK nuclease domain-containing protein [Pseudomonas aeruginosa]